jgi:hypothetical protein
MGRGVRATGLVAFIQSVAAVLLLSACGGSGQQPAASTTPAPAHSPLTGAPRSAPSALGSRATIGPLDSAEIRLERYLDRVARDPCRFPHNKVIPCVHHHEEDVSPRFLAEQVLQQAGDSKEHRAAVAWAHSVERVTEAAKSLDQHSRAAATRLIAAIRAIADEGDRVVRKPIGPLSRMWPRPDVVAINRVIPDSGNGSSDNGGGGSPDAPSVDGPP